MKRCVIFGGSGYIGRALVPELAKRFPTTELVVACRRLPKLPTSATNSQISYSKCDITNEQDIKAVAQNADLLINLVGIMEEAGGNSFAAVQSRAPAIMAGIVADRLERGEQGRLIHISALGADPTSSIPYPRTKGEAEQQICDTLNKVADGRNIAALILRPGLVISQQDQFLNRFALLTKLFPVFPIFGGGYSKFQPIMRQDLVKIIVNACSPELSQQHQQIPCKSVIIEVGGGSVLPFKDIVYATSRKPSYPSWIRWIIPPYFVTMPMWLSLLQGSLFEALFPPGHLFRLSRDQIRLLQIDNCVTGSTVNSVKNMAIIPVSSVDTDKLKQVLCRGVEFQSMQQVYFAGQWIKH